MKTFYVYELRDENKIPFYVGKGSGRRMYSHEYRARNGNSSHLSNKIRAIWRRGGQVTSNIVFETDNESLAYEEEKRLITLYGRDNLTNKTDGGDGTTNPSPDAREKIAASRRGKLASEITKSRQRAAKLGKHRSPETKEKIAKYQKGTKKPWAKSNAIKNLAKMTWQGKKHRPETIEKMRLAKIGHPVSEETRAKISASKMGSIPWNKGTRKKEKSNADSDV